MSSHSHHDCGGRNDLGNTLVIDHGKAEYPVLGYLQSDSQVVKPGEKVALGMRLGHCGSSGNTSEPHTHHHLQDSPAPGSGDGFPLRSGGLVLGSVQVAAGEPHREQRIADVR